MNIWSPSDRCPGGTSSARRDLKGGFHLVREGLSYSPDRLASSADLVRDGTTRRASTFLLLLLMNLTTLAPCFAPSALYLPQLVTYARRAGPIFLLATAVATT